MLSTEATTINGRVFPNGLFLFATQGPERFEIVDSIPSRVRSRGVNGDTEKISFCIW